MCSRAAFDMQVRRGPNRNQNVKQPNSTNPNDPALMGATAIVMEEDGEMIRNQSCMDAFAHTR